MMKKLAVSAMLAMLASSAFAAEGSGFYAGVDMGRATTFGSTSTSSGIFGGYQFNPYVSVEGGFRRLGESKETFRFYSPSSGDYGFYSRTVSNQESLSVIGSLPVADKVSVFGRLGYQRLITKEKVTGTKWTDERILAGIGATYALTPNLNARVEYQHLDSHARNIGIGLGYKF